MPDTVEYAREGKGLKWHRVADAWRSRLCVLSACGRVMGDAEIVTTKPDGDLCKKCKKWEAASD